MQESKKSLCRDSFPGYMGHIPLKNEVLGMTVGASNEFIRAITTMEPPKDQLLKPLPYSDYSHYNKDYFNGDFCKDYKLEEDKINSNQSKEADTWVGGSKYKIYPQHIPGYKSHVPGIYSSNIHGMGYSKSTAVAVKGEYCKGADVPADERYRSTAKAYFTKPKVSEECKY
jgi:hypothetical protein